MLLVRKRVGNLHVHFEFRCRAICTFVLAVCSTTLGQLDSNTLVNGWLIDWADLTHFPLMQSCCRGNCYRQGDASRHGSMHHANNHFHMQRPTAFEHEWVGFDVEKWSRRPETTLSRQIPTFLTKIRYEFSPALYFILIQVSAGLTGLRLFVRFNQSDVAYLLSKPGCFAVFGPPGAGKSLVARMVAQFWKCLLITRKSEKQRRMSSSRLIFLRHYIFAGDEWSIDSFCSGNCHHGGVEATGHCIRAERVSPYEGWYTRDCHFWAAA